MPSCDIALPDQITAGLDFQAVVSSDDYPAPTWTLNAHLRGPMAIDLTATVDGLQQVFSAPAATTTAWTPGAYWYSIQATDGSAIVEVTGGQLTIKPNLASIMTPYDGRSQNEIALEAIDAVMAKRASQDQLRYKINERELWRTPISDLLKMRAYYAVQVSRERAKASGCSRFGRPVIVKFS